MDKQFIEKMGKVLEELGLCHLSYCRFQIKKPVGPDEVSQYGAARSIIKLKGEEGYQVSVGGGSFPVLTAEAALGIAMMEFNGNNSAEDIPTIREIMGDPNA